MMSKAIYMHNVDRYILSMNCGPHTVYLGDQSRCTQRSLDMLKQSLFTQLEAYSAAGKQFAQY